MPCNGETDSYHSFVECIEQLQELIYTYQGTHEIIIGANKLSNMDSVINSIDLNKTVCTINKLLTDSAKECYPDRKKGKKKQNLKL